MDALGDFFERVYFQRQIHATLAADQICHDGNFRTLRALEEQCGAGGFDGAIRDFGDFENWVNFVRDAHEFVFLFERPQEIPQIAISHFPSLYRSMNPKPDTLTRASGAAHCAGRFEAME